MGTPKQPSANASGGGVQFRGRGISVRKAAFLAVLGMTALGAMALAGASSAAKPASGSVVPRAAGSHVGARLVRQVGARNYAGPNCPGAGWNGTTATRV